MVQSEILTAAIVFWGLVLGGSAYAVRRFLRAYERRTGNATELAALRERVAALEDTIENVQGSVERLNASQEFTTRLLGARSATGERTT